MSNASATEYAESIAKEIQDRVESGYPFGVEHMETGEEFDTMDEALAEFPNASESDFTEASAYRYLEGVLDIQYVVSREREYRSARILIAFGGPTAWINTGTGQIEAAWWSETVYRELPSEFIQGLDDALEELYGC